MKHENDPAITRLGTANQDSPLSWRIYSRPIPRHRKLFHTSLKSQKKQFLHISSARLRPQIPRSDSNFKAFDRSLLSIEVTSLPRGLIRTVKPTSKCSLPKRKFRYFWPCTSKFTLILAVAIFLSQISGHDRTPVTHNTPLLIQIPRPNPEQSDKN